ncbi:MAG: hypothetical protein AB4372_25145 [Xenococcus sp. (in: cyanobacteria)]
MKSTKIIESLGIAIALILLFVMFVLAIFSTINLFNVNDNFLSPKNQEVKIKNEIEPNITLEDCQELINQIYLSESQIHNVENHRYIEAVSSSQHINLDYQAGAKKLQEVAEQYLTLYLNSESGNYSQKLAKKLQEKAQLFETRSEITADAKNQSEIKQLLDKMDSVTKERLNAIESLENQCELIND